MNSKKTLKRVLPISLATTMLASGAAMALPGDEPAIVVLGEKAFTLDALSETAQVNAALEEAQINNKGMYYSVPGQTDGYVSLTTNAAMTAAEADELHYIQYYSKKTGVLKTSTFRNFEDPTPIEEVQVVGQPVINSMTSLTVSFSNGITQTFTVDAMHVGSNEVTITYLGTDFLLTVNFQEEVVTVVGQPVVNSKTSITVTFSDGVTQTFTVPTMNEGANQVTITYNAKPYTVTVNVPVILVQGTVVVDRNTIKVTFSDGQERTFSNLNLVTGDNTVSVVYEGKTFSITVNVPQPAESKVEAVEFVNYRNLKVTFNTIVDTATAQNAANYYFEIVDGNADYGISHLGKSNQLSKIVTDYVGGADLWWNGSVIAPLAPRHINAKVVAGKTVVDIQLPEDARFTTLEDKRTTLDTGAGDNDDERTLFVKQRNSPNESIVDVVTLFKLVKKSVVNVAVRNVKDVDGKFTIDTAVNPMKIEDTTNPILKQLVKITPATSAVEVLQEGDLPRDLGTVNLVRSVGSSTGVADKIGFVYNEPVFDAHDINMSDLEFKRGVELVVNGTLIASSEIPGNDLHDYLKFDMTSQSTYDQAKFVTLDVEKAVKRLRQMIPNHNQVPDVNEVYTIQILGVTDLAGNIEVQSNHTVKVKFYDLDPQQIVLVYPRVLGIEQVGDNLFRVEFNRAGASGILRIKNPDGEGVGEITKPVTESAPSENGKFYSYVSVDATDLDAANSVPQGTTRNNYLSYDLQDWILRQMIVENVSAMHGILVLQGSNYNPVEKKKLVNDILAPVVVQPDVIKYEDKSNVVLEMHVKDTNPWVADENVIHNVKPVKYDYNPMLLRFDERASNNQALTNDHFKPVVVSYVDKNGATHKVVVSNYSLRPINNLGTITPGFPGSITWNEVTDTLCVDLLSYPELLDEAGQLVEGATYKVEIPTGYFTDPSRDDLYNNGIMDFEYNGVGHDLLYVDYARVPVGMQPPAAPMGYTSKEAVVNIAVQTKPVPPPSLQAVPQTSKQLIYYYEPTNTLRVEFTGTIDVNTLKNKANYKIDGKTLAQWDTLLGTNTEIEYQLIDGKQFASFVIPQNSIVQKANYEFVVSGVSHPEGGTMTPVITTVRLRDNFCPVVEEAIVTGSRQLKLTFNEPLRYNVSQVNDEMAGKAARNFKVMVNGMEWTVVSATLPSGITTQTQVKLDLGNVLPEGAVITVEVIKDQNGVMHIVDNSEFNNPMKLATYTVTR